MESKVYKKTIIKKVFIIFSLFAFYFNGVAQPTPYSGTILFNLVETESSRGFITPAELESKNIIFLADGEDSELKYDTLHKAFSFRTNGSETKIFAIIYNKDTIFISYPSIRFRYAVFVKSAIPLNGNSFAFANEYTYDAMNTNHYYNTFNIFYLCQACWLEPYKMSEEYKKNIRKEYFTHIINLKIE